MRSTSCLILCSLVLTIIALNSRAVVASAYEQPLQGFAWSPRQIPVVIQKSPEYAHDAVLEAMQTWNLAQIWFSNTYHVSSRPYTFVEVQQLGESYVRVTFNQTQTTNDWSTTNCYYWWNTDGVFYRIQCNMSIDLSIQDGTELSPLKLRSLATAGFGFSLGLLNTVFSQTDLLNWYSVDHDIVVPSTLNLYAVALLSMVTSRNDMPNSPVTLSGDIPYETPSESAITESVSTTTQEPAVSSTTTQSSYLSQPHLHLGDSWTYKKDIGGEFTRTVTAVTDSSYTLTVTGVYNNIRALNYKTGGSEITWLETTGNIYQTEKWSSDWALISASGVLFVSNVYGVCEFSYEFKGLPQVYSMPLSVGKAWNYVDDATVTATCGSKVFHPRYVARNVEARVLRNETLSVGDREIQSLVIQRTYKALSSSDKLAVTSYTEWFSLQAKGVVKWQIAFADCEPSTELLVAFSLGRDTTRISCSANPQTASVSNFVVIECSFEPPFEGIPVILRVTEPPQSESMRPLLTSKDGKFSTRLQVDVPGQWNVTASFQGNEDLEPSSSSQISIRVERPLPTPLWSFGQSSLLIGGIIIAIAVFAVVAIRRSLASAGRTKPRGETLDKPSNRYGAPSEAQEADYVEYLARLEELKARGGISEETYLKLKDDYWKKFGVPPTAPSPVQSSGVEFPAGKFCISCGTSLPSHATFCNKCGTKQ